MLGPCCVDIFGRAECLHALARVLELPYFVQVEAPIFASLEKLSEVE